MSNLKKHQITPSPQHKKFQNKYRSPSHRMPDWDYAGTGYYFITMVTQNRICYLADIENGEMVPTDFGGIVETEWPRSFEIRDELILDEWIMMPNHIHAIVIIQHEPKNWVHPVGGMDIVDCMDPVDDTNPVKTHGRASLLQQQQQQQQQSQSGQSTKFNRYNHFFQPNYHDRIIRNELEYLRIKKYIRDNPSNWVIDNLNKKDRLHSYPHRRDFDRPSKMMRYHPSAMAFAVFEIFGDGLVGDFLDGDFVEELGGVHFELSGIIAKEDDAVWGEDVEAEIEEDGVISVDAEGLHFHAF